MRTAAMIVLLAAAPAAAQAQPPAQSYPSQAGPLAVETIARGLDHPWAIAFLPDGRLMVSERPGRLRLIAKDGALSPPLSGVPPVFARRQGGLLDVALDRDFATNRTLFFCYAESADGGARTTLARARRADDATRLDDVRPIFRQEGPLSSGNHFGCRIAQASDGNLFLTLGDHFGPRDEAQNLANHIGKIVRVTPDGAAPPDNPFVGRKDARQEIWSYGQIGRAHV